MQPTELAQQYYTTVDSGDAEATADLFAPDAVYHRGGYEPMIGSVIRDFYRGDRVIESGSHTVTTLVAQQNTVAVQGEFTGRLKDGSEVSIGFADFFVFNADGLIQTRSSYFMTPGV